MPWQPILDVSELVAAATEFEKHTLDFKKEVDRDARAELAKDVAAFANHIGGTILVGVPNAGATTAAAYNPMTGKSVRAVQLAYEQAVDTHCNPHPSIEATPLQYARDKFVLAVNVYPFPGVVGVRTKSGSSEWRFPIRFATQTNYLRPLEVAMYSPAVRNAVISLGRLAKKTVVRRVREPLLKGGTNDKTDLLFDETEVESNRFSVKTFRSDVKIYYPLDMVRTVYKGDHGWEICMEAFR